LSVIPRVLVGPRHPCTHARTLHLSRLISLLTNGHTQVHSCFGVLDRLVHVRRSPTTTSSLTCCPPPPPPPILFECVRLGDGPPETPWVRTCATCGNWVGASVLPHSWTPPSPPRPSRAPLSSLCSTCPRSVQPLSLNDASCSCVLSEGVTKPVWAAHKGACQCGDLAQSGGGEDGSVHYLPGRFRE